MSQTFSLVCHETKRSIWIGQGHGVMRSFYYGDARLMQNVREFLNEHIEMDFQFLCDDTHDSIGDYEEWSERIPGSETQQYCQCEWCGGMFWGEPNADGSLPIKCSDPDRPHNRQETIAPTQLRTDVDRMNQWFKDNPSYLD